MKLLRSPKNQTQKQPKSLSRKEKPFGCLDSINSSKKLYCLARQAVIDAVGAVPGRLQGWP
jgi:hypothetical protein